MQISYCGDLVRNHDPDRFLISMFAPAQVREDLWALFAFNHEISKTRYVVSEATLGLIRLQWWRDSITAIYEGKNVPEHEVLKPLAEVIKRHDLPQEHFDKLIYAREFDLEDVQPANIEGLMNYADFTTQPLLKLAIRICGDDPEQEIVQPVAVNYTLAGVLRATAYNARNGLFLFPDDLMKKYNVTKNTIFEEKGQESAVPLVKEIVGCRLPKSKPDHVILKACEALSDIYFKQIISSEYKVLSPDLQRSPPFKVLRLFWKIKIL